MCLNLLNAELNPICHLLALLGAQHILHVSRIRVKEIGWESLGRIALAQDRSKWRAPVTVKTSISIKRGEFLD